jgi:hypothetical protein
MRAAYQSRAEEILALAEEFRDPGERKRLLEVAGGYMALARYVADRHEHGTAPRSVEHDPAHRPVDAESSRGKPPPSFFSPYS